MCEPPPVRNGVVASVDVALQTAKMCDRQPSIVRRPTAITAVHTYVTLSTAMLLPPVEGTLAYVLRCSRTQLASCLQYLRTYVRIGTEPHLPAHRHYR